MKPTKITIRGGRWFQKSAGNTYCGARICIDDSINLVAPYEYGYGDYYLQSAERVIRAAGYELPEWFCFSGCKDEGIELEYSAHDFARERDLLAFLQ